MLAPGRKSPWNLGVARAPWNLACVCFVVLLLPLVVEGASSNYEEGTGTSQQAFKVKHLADASVASEEQWCSRPLPPVEKPRQPAEKVVPQIQIAPLTKPAQPTHRPTPPTLSRPLKAVRLTTGPAHVVPSPPHGAPRPACRVRARVDKQAPEQAIDVAPSAPSASAGENDPTLSAASDGSERPAKRSLLVIPSPDEFVKVQRETAPTAEGAAVGAAGPLQGGVSGSMRPPTNRDGTHILPSLETPDVGHTRVASSASSADTGEAVKRRINLAAAGDGASIVAANKEARKPEKTIDTDDDSYMKNSCSAHKWLIIELSQLGRVDEVELVNKEMYSSRVRDFSVRGRQSHPRKDAPPADYPRWFATDQWPLLGNMTAANRKGAQAFKLAFPARVRYVLFQFHTHYGSEDMCALNSISVFGVSAAQELEEALAAQIDSEPAPATPGTQQQVAAAGNSDKQPPQVPSAPPAADPPKSADSLNSAVPTEHPPLPMCPSPTKLAVGRQHLTCGSAELLLTPPLVHTCDLPARDTRGAPLHSPDSVDLDEYSDDGSDSEADDGLIQDISTAPSDTQARPAVSTEGLGASVGTDVLSNGSDVPPGRPTGAGDIKVGAEGAQQRPAATHVGAHTHAPPEPSTRPPHRATGSVHTQAPLTAGQHTIPEPSGTPGQGSPPVVLKDADGTGQKVPSVPEPVMKVSIPVQPDLPTPPLSISATSSVTTNTGGSGTLTTSASPTHAEAAAAVHAHPPVQAQPHVTSPPLPPAALPGGPQSALPEGEGAARRVFVLPPPDAGPTSQLDNLLHAVEGGSAAKPKQAGNLFDVFKQEFVLLRLNQTRTWQYIAGLVEVLNRNAAEAGQELDTLEKAVSALETRLGTLPAMVEAGVSRRVAHKYDQQINRLLVSVQTLHEQVAVSRQREWAMLLYCSAVLAIVLAVTLTHSSRLGQGTQAGRTFIRVVCVLGVLNGLIGVTLQSQRLQRALALFLGMQMS